MLRLLFPRSLLVQGFIVASVVLLLVLEVAGAMAVYKMSKKWRRQTNRAQREARRLTNKPPAAATQSVVDELIVDKHLHSDFFMEPRKNDDWQVVRAEDFSVRAPLHLLAVLMDLTLI
jgi:hypothetical protein